MDGCIGIGSGAGGPCGIAVTFGQRAHHVANPSGIYCGPELSHPTPLAFAGEQAQIPAICVGEQSRGHACGAPLQHGQKHHRYSSYGAQSGGKPATGTGPLDNDAWRICDCDGS